LALIRRASSCNRNSNGQGTAYPFQVDLRLRLLEHSRCFFDHASAMANRLTLVPGQSSETARSTSFEKAPVAARF
jgi:hypothetical protein